MQAREKQLLVVFFMLLFLFIILAVVRRSKYIKPLTKLAATHISKLRTGDLLLFNTAYNVNMDIIKFTLGTPYVHVGIVFVDAAGVQFVFEVCTNGRGNQLNQLRRRVLEKDEICVVRQIEPELSPRAFEKEALRLLGEPYSYNIVPVCLRAWMRGFILLPNTSQEKKARVCTQLVAEMYIRMHVFDKGALDCDTAALTPKDFSQDGNRMPLLYPYKFGREARVFL